MNRTPIVKEERPHTQYTRVGSNLGKVYDFVRWSFKKNSVKTVKYGSRKVQIRICPINWISMQRNICT